MSILQSYVIHLGLLATGDPSKQFEAIVDEFYALEQADPDLLDSSWSLTLGEDDDSRVEVDLTVIGRSEDEAWSKAMSSIRAAIHAGGGSTPSWDERTDDLRPRFVIIESQGITAVAV